MIFTSWALLKQTQIKTTAMEIKILVKEHQKNDLQNFINDCEKHGFKVTRQGGGNLPNFSGFYAELKGDKWKQDWIPIEENLPICAETGSWDGKRSDYVLVKFQDGNWSKAILYSGFMDGHKFNDWYDERDYEIKEIITHWKPIELY